MALSAERRAEMDAALKKSIPTSGRVLTAERRAQMDAVLAKQRTAASPTQSGGFGDFVKGALNLPLSLAGAASGTLEGIGHLGAAGLHALTGNQQGAQQQIAQAEQATKQGGVIGRATGVAPAFSGGSGPYGMQTLPEFGKEVVSKGLEIGSLIAPIGAGAGLVSNIAGKGLLTGIKASVPSLGRAVGFDALAGGIGGAGQSMGEEGATPGSVLTGTALGAGASALTGGLLRGIGGTGQAAKAITNKLFQRGTAETVQSYGARLANSIIKPLEKEFRFGRDPGASVVKENIIGNSLEDYAQKISQRLQEVGQQMDVVLSAPKVVSQRLNVKPAIDAIDSSIREAISGGNSTLRTRLREIKDGLEYRFVERGGKLVKSEPKNLTLSPKEAQELKIAIGKRIKFTSEAFGSDVNQAQRKIYDALNDLVNKTAPEMKELNERWGGLFSAVKSIERTMNVGERGAMVKTSDLIAGAAGTDALGPAGLSAVFARHFVESTAFKSRLAKVLSNLGGEKEAERLLLLGVREQAEALKKIPLLQRPKVKSILDEARKVMLQMARSAAIGSDVEKQENQRQAGSPVQTGQNVTRPQLPMLQGR